MAKYDFDKTQTDEPFRRIPAVQPFFCRFCIPENPMREGGGDGGRVWSQSPGPSPCVSFGLMPLFLAFIHFLSSTLVEYIYNQCAWHRDSAGRLDSRDHKCVRVRACACVQFLAWEGLGAERTDQIRELHDGF